MDDRDKILPENGTKNENFEGIPGETVEQKTKENTSTEYRRLKPLFGIGLIALGMFVLLRVYMAIFEGFIGVTLPPVLAIFGFVLVASMVLAAVNRLAKEKKVGALDGVR